MKVKITFYLSSKDIIIRALFENYEKLAKQSTKTKFINFNFFSLDKNNNLQITKELVNFTQRKKNKLRMLYFYC